VSAVDWDIMPHDTGSRFFPEFAPESLKVRLIEDAGNAPRLQDKFKVNAPGVWVLFEALGISILGILELGGWKAMALVGVSSENWLVFCLTDSSSLLIRSSINSFHLIIVKDRHERYKPR
jgi:hypothetical protein